MKVVESKKKNYKDFGSIIIGTVFRFNGSIFVKTADFFSAENIEDYFERNYRMEEVNDMYSDYDAYNAYCLSSDARCAFSSINGNTEVEVLEAELHIV